jgi:urea carboxylase system permease
MMIMSADHEDLAKLGYKQELDRSLGKFSSFAAGFSYLSILTGVFQLFAFGFSTGGPAFFWTWPTVFIGQGLVALCFAELAGQYPMAGSVYQWSKQIAKPFTSWMAGWLMIIGSILTVAAVAVAYQIILPQITTWFQFVGGPSDVGVSNTPDGAKNAIILALGLVIFTTIVNIVGVKLMARINNFGVAVELVGVTLLIVFLAVHIKRGPQVVFDTFGTGATYPSGYIGAFLVAGLMSAYIFYGFDTAGSLAEETSEPRKNAPIGIIRAVTAAALTGGLLILVAMMAVPDLHAADIATAGLPYIVKATLGPVLGDIFLSCSAIAITVCALAVHTAGVRMVFAMARDGRLPFGSKLAKVSGKSKTPVVPALIIGIGTLLLLVVNLGNQQVFYVLTSVAILFFYLAYLSVTGPLLMSRFRGEWPQAEHGKFFNLGKWGKPVNLVAVVFQIGMIINLAWPRPAIYGDSHWYLQWGAFVFVGLSVGIGGLYYFVKQRNKGIMILAEHRPALVISAQGEFAHE